MAFGLLVKRLMLAGYDTLAFGRLVKRFLLAGYDTLAFGLLVKRLLLAGYDTQETFYKSTKSQRIVPSQ